MSEEDGFSIDTVEALDGTYEPVPWPFAVAHAAAIGAHWTDALRERPLMFDGRVLMQTRGGVVPRDDGGRVFRAAYTDVAFSAFLAWRDLGHPVRGFRNGFGMAALQGSDGAFVLGEMASHTANAGRIYFPSGTPDRTDIVGAAVDIAGSIRRELTEETGLDPAEIAFAPRFTVIQDGLRVCMMQAARAADPADRLVARIAAWSARETLPELVRMHIVRSETDITPAMPPFVRLYLRRAFAGADRTPRGSAPA